MLTLLSLLSSEACVRALSSASWVLDPGGRGLLSTVSYEDPAFRVPCSTNELPSENKVHSGFSVGVSF